VCYNKYRKKEKEYIKMLKKKITEMNIGDEFVVEYGCYGNYTKAIIVGIQDTNYDYIKEVDYTIPEYTGDEIRHKRMIEVEVKG
jgi:hypothetical protein